MKSYQQEEWYAQFLWPIFKSKKEGSELAHNGPMVKEDVTETLIPTATEVEYADNELGVNLKSV